MSKIVVDIVSPSGGKEGGIEDVIKAWTRYLDPETFKLRVMHMTPGIAYLEGYKDAYYLNGENENVDPSHCASGYNLLISNFGAPDICIATNTPFMSAVCAEVRRFNNLNMSIFSWVHNEISRYQSAGQGGINEMLRADYHFVLNSSMEKELLNASPDAIVYNIGNPILHDIPADCTPAPNKLAFVGRLAEVKRLDIILEAMYKAKSSWYLDIIGDGQIQAEVKSWIKLLKLEQRVRLMGWQQNPLEYMKDATAMVSASDYEGFMITGAEALAMGKPIICTPTQGLIEYVSDSINGYFFDFNSADSLAQILDRISDGSLPVPDSDICKASVEKYRKENYFRAVAEILKKRAPENPEPLR